MNYRKYAEKLKKIVIFNDAALGEVRGILVELLEELDDDFWLHNDP